MNTLLRMTGIGEPISFYRYFYFNGPGVTKFSGIGLILVIGLAHMYVFPEHFEATPYIGLSCRFRGRTSSSGGRVPALGRPECAHDSRRGTGERE